jgi:hypothetical protein
MSNLITLLNVVNQVLGPKRLSIQPVFAPAYIYFAEDDEDSDEDSDEDDEDDDEKEEDEKEEEDEEKDEDEDGEEK